MDFVSLTLEQPLYFFLSFLAEVLLKKGRILALFLRLSSFEDASKIQSGKQRKSQRVFIKHAGVEKRQAARCGTKHKTKIGTR